MPLYVAKAGSPLVERACLSTPLVALETDAPLESVPAPVRRAADLGDSFDLGRWSRAETQPGAHATIVRFPGERLITGESDYIRRDLHVADQRMFVPVHLACSNEIDLVGLQPRWYSGRPASDGINQAVRISGNADLAPPLREFFEHAAEPWARLYRALLHGSLDAQAGLAQLERFRSSPGVHPTLDALALRNRIALLVSLEDYAEARRGIKRGIAAYPDYAELSYLGALVSLAESDLSRAVAQLQEATRKTNPRLVGSGGENSYRAHWLVATLSEGVGNESVAFHHFRGGLYARSAFEPSVVSLLKHRFPEDAMKQLAYDLAALARREPKYLEPVAYYLLLHGKVDIVRRMLETHAMNAGIRARLAERLAAFSPARAEGRAQGPPGVLPDRSAVRAFESRAHQSRTRRGPARIPEDLRLPRAARLRHAPPRRFPARGIARNRLDAPPAGDAPHHPPSLAAEFPPPGAGPTRGDSALGIWRRAASLDRGHPSRGR